MNLDELISEAGQAAGDIGNAVSEAVRTGNYSHLSEEVEQSVSRVTSQFDVRVNRAGKSPSGGAGAAEAVRWRLGIAAPRYSVCFPWVWQWSDGSFPGKRRC